MQWDDDPLRSDKFLVLDAIVRFSSEFKGISHDKISFRDLSEFVDEFVDGWTLTRGTVVKLCQYQVDAKTKQKEGKMGNKAIILAAVMMAVVLQSCAIVHVGEPYKKAGNATTEATGTEPLRTEVACVQVNPSTGTYTIDASGCVANVGDAYRAAYKCALLAGAYGHGDKQWNDEYEEWLDSDSEESPEKFNDIDGKAYHDAVRAAEDAGSLASC